MHTQLDPVFYTVVLNSASLYVEFYDTDVFDPVSYKTVTLLLFSAERRKEIAIFQKART